MVGIAERVQKHRKNLRKQGMRPMQIWVPDTRSAAFKKECRRQSLLLKNDPHEKDILGFVEESADRSGWIE
jgi:hypothetical protein